MITLLTGANYFALQQTIDGAVNDFVQKNGDLGLEQLDGEEVSFERICEALQSMPFLAGAKLVIIRNPGAHKQFQEQFESLMPSIPDCNSIIIIETKLDKRSSYYKALKKLTLFKEFIEPAGIELEHWATDYVESIGGTLSSSDARYLIERTGQGQQGLSMELQKLLAYDPNITRDSIITLTNQSPQGTMFDLIETALSGKAERALNLYEEQRKLKIEPQQILAMLAWQLQVIALVKTAGSRSAESIAKDAKLNPYSVKKTMNLSRTISNDTLKSLIKQALDIDIRQKSSTLDVDDALRHFILRIGTAH